MAFAYFGVISRLASHPPDTCACRIWHPSLPTFGPSLLWHSPDKFAACCCCCCHWPRLISLAALEYLVWLPPACCTPKWICCRCVRSPSMRFISHRAPVGGVSWRVSRYIFIAAKRMDGLTGRQSGRQTDRETDSRTTKMFSNVKDTINYKRFSRRLVTLSPAVAVTGAAGATTICCQLEYWWGCGWGWDWDWSLAPNESQLSRIDLTGFECNKRDKHCS